MPTTGLREYRNRHLSGITLLLNPTGEMYRPNWTMNGMMYRKSRYFTFNAVIQRLGPRLARNAKITNNGNNNICGPGTYWYQTIIKTSSEKLIKKSTIATTTVAAGTINLGKYTLLIKFAFVTRLFEASASAVEKNVHGSIPANTINAYGAAPSLGNFATRPKITVKTIMVKKGRISAHATPMTVCL